MKPINLAKRAVVALALPVVLVAIWWVATANSTSIFWPPLSRIVGVFGETWFTGRFTADVLPSLARLFVGYLAALALGVAMGVAIGSFRVLRGLVEPVLEFFRAIPPPVLVPILMLFAGIGNEMKVLVIVSGCLWPVLLNTVEGVRGLDEVLRDTARCYRLGPRARLLRLILPGASPQIAAGARQALSIGIILMVISEMFAASNGVGFTIIQFQRSFAIPQMWTGIIVLGLIGIALSVIFRMVERRLLSWYIGVREAHRTEG
ncbi:nitrate ABC transporter permease [Thermopolyspora flexuosa]|jgi:ABC-type nitrate/sulfonate/bicarbonate transport system permease component|uniref:ABC-type nitrate/sulfonate/bicarbonate transport system permease component n=1 Tax=Thermopolyspora flexuosa TaxID=103836 RepID=A0A543IX62_9ACTN|nr:ABC transporter permease [Thermopolyspora flexuosa]PZN43390.1 MAG: nitrate ABC transporter permease [Actinomycetota bacterium]TQM75147.1 ABC-type nitrate/sulfonate/bicarbonate transport system permease component [Thermopolyspora flexuosa]GGM91777.1 nitrate ABC transporter permease [Thermopolyspora flexuosa]